MVTLSITPEDADQTVLPDSKPGLPSFWPEQPPPVPLIVNVNVVEPVCEAESVAVAVTLYVPAVVGVPDTVPPVPDLLPGLVTVTEPPDGVQVGSPVWAGTETAFQAALTALNWPHVASRFFAAVSVQVRYFRYDEPVVFISIASYRILIAFWMPMPV